MSTIVNRVAKGSKLTFAEVDANFSNLNTDKAEVVHSDTPPSSATVGDFWFDTSTLTTYVYYNSQWVQSVVASGGNAGGSGISLASLSVGAEGTASGDGGIAYNNSTGVFTYTPPVISGSSTTVVSSSANLPTSPSNGDLAFAVDTSRLYLSRNNAWYSVALVNTAPSVSGNSATYELATNGTATVVTMTATDAEGDPITWSHTASGLGSIATISRSNNVFTITPNTSNVSGTFSVSFQASDGANTATATSSFTLVFETPLTRGTQLLTKTSGNNNRTNSVFDDSSTSNHTITANGDVYQSSFSPYSVPDGHWSVIFDGTADQINLPASNDFKFGTGDFSLEFWIKETSRSSERHLFDTSYSGATGNPYQIYSVNGLIKRWTSAGGELGLVTIDLNTWTHVSINRISGSLTVYKDGILEGTHSDTTNWDGVDASRPPSIGAARYGANMIGSIADFHIVKGTGIRTANFSVKEPVTAHSNTKLLACRSNRIKDAHTTAHALTVGGDPLVSLETPIPIVLPDIWKSATGGSAYFDGSGDYLRTATSADFTLGSGDFSCEHWLNTDFSGGTGQVIDLRKSGDSTSVDWCTYITSSQTYNLWIVGADRAVSGTLDKNAWHHISINRISGVTKMYVNGVQAGSNYTDTNSYVNDQLTVGIHGLDASSDPYKGYLSDINWVKGTGIRTGAFSVPTALTSNHSNTKLKMNFTDAGIFDSSGRNSIKLIGNTKESTAQTKYGTTSFYLDGSGDYVNIPDIIPPYLDDFQLEGWFYETSSGDNGLFQAFAPLSSSTGGVAIGTVGATMWYQQANSQTNIGSHWGQNAWKHLSVVRRNGTQHLFVDGTRIDVRANTTNLTDGQINIGGYYSTSNLTQAYYEDFRYIKGHTTYPNERPQIPLTAVSGTSLQLANASTIPSSPNGLTLTASEGSPTVSIFTPPYSTVTHSIYYDGNDVTKLDANTALNFGASTDFTIEGHFYLVANVSTNNALFDNRVTDNNEGFSIRTNGTNMSLYSVSNLVNNIPFSFKKWHHIVYQRKTVSGTPTHQIYVDGMFIGESTTARTYGNNAFYIGGAMGTSENHNMYVSDFRIVKGSAVYDKSFTPPTGAL